MFTSRINVSGNCFSYFKDLIGPDLPLDCALGLPREKVLHVWAVTGQKTPPSPLPQFCFGFMSNLEFCILSIQGESAILLFQNEVFLLRSQNVGQLDRTHKSWVALNGVVRNENQEHRPGTTKDRLRNKDKWRTLLYPKNSLCLLN